MRRIPSLPVTLLALLNLAAPILAQSTTSPSYPSSSSKTTSSAAATLTVRVGDGSHTFQPDVVQARPGDTVEFDFYPQNHSVVRAEYLKPCIPYEMTGAGKVGFFSGFHPVDAILDEPPKWRILINDSDPIFYYCSAPGSCINYAMVGVINPNASVSLQSQKDAAKKSSYMLQPGEPFPAEGSSSSTSSASHSSAPTSITTAPSSSNTVLAAASSGSHSSLGGGAIAGIAIGSAAVALLIAGLLFFMARSRRLKREMLARQGMVEGGHHQGQLPPMAPMPMSPRGDMVPGMPPAGTMYQSGGTVFVPFKTDDPNQRASGTGFTPVPPYETQYPQANLAGGHSPRAMSPHSEAGSTYSVPTHPALRGEQTSPPENTSPLIAHEMYAPMPKRG